MALTAAFGLICEKGDVKNAFTKATLDQNVYTHTAPGYDLNGMVYRLKKALYGLKALLKL
jgi:hypothetical protein